MKIKINMTPFLMVIILSFLVFGCAATTVNTTKPAGPPSDMNQATCQEKLNTYNNILESNPVDKITFLNKGVILQKSGHPDQAIANYLNALDSDSPEIMKLAHNNIGTAYFQKGEYIKAMAHLNAAIEKSGNRYASAYVNRGLVKEGLGDYKGAYQDFKTALILKGDLTATPSEFRRVAMTAPASGKALPAADVRQSPPEKQLPKPDQTTAIITMVKAPPAPDETQESKRPIKKKGAFLIP
tara:strand:- start:985 stop:1707 length:723 start_codon:yes stop_codon:yes gene_type:complete